MSAHLGTLRDVTHRMRVMATQMVAHIDHCLPELSPDQRSDLQEWPRTILSFADDLLPIDAAALPDRENVVRLGARS